MTKKRGRPAIDITGHKIGSLTAVRFVGTDKHQHRLWLLRCDCGGERTETVSNFRKTPTQVIGCKQCWHQRLSMISSTHGASLRGHPDFALHCTWIRIRQRCENQRHKDYRFYGAKGISVCDEWRQFEAFREWALKSGYRCGLTIERVNPNWHYDPSNCEWVTQSVNSWRAGNPGHYWRSMTCNA